MKMRMRLQVSYETVLKKVQENLSYYQLSENNLFFYGTNTAPQLRKIKFF